MNNYYLKLSKSKYLWLVYNNQSVEKVFLYELEAKEYIQRKTNESN